MSDNCTHDCATCGEDCSEAPQILVDKPHELSSIKKVIGIVSGKGGVGKSIVTSLLAVLMQRKGNKTAILDADLTGPSIPRAFGIKGRAKGSETGLYPLESKLGTKVMSVNLLLANDTDPVVWRGPVISGAVRQFWTEVIWQDVDYMFVDMPPGTGDVPLTVFQSLPVDGVIIVTTPQDLVSMIVAKAVKMTEITDIPVIGLVENMSYFECPDCGGKHSIFGEGRVDETAEKFGISSTASIPLNSKLTSACDNGLIELFVGDWLDDMVKVIEKL